MAEENGDAGKALKSRIGKLLGNEENEPEAPEGPDEETLRIQEQCNREVAERLRKLDDNFSVKFESLVSNIGERYQGEAKNHITSRQTDVLRANKVLREVSRELGADWKFVFQCLMAGFPVDVINREIEKIERQRPFLQPYKALITWRDLKGQNFDINNLIEVLKTGCKDQLAQKALAILHSDYDGLFMMGDVGKGIASGIEIIDDDDDDEALQRRRSMRRASVTGPVCDRNLLQVARKLGSAWYQVGTNLCLPEEELEEIKTAEGDSYQAAFRMLWLWRDKAAEECADNVDVVAGALKGAGREDLVAVLNPPTEED